ncbi:Dna2/Cas4 domain-containing protein [Methanobacterium sp. BAmetb5]|uniref:CRISPR-associated protein Cas4 n=1 Tax=Methanobacterium sp. BAmetb5 TaxID=2025351 RepID=UPI000E87B1C2|nr:Dna2/Cas4 domain-containing protein [Methanobacterium sp. BAmetb5]AXV40601.1 MAG: CRISPR-associated protein Cas4 [Methanobacterium sp. BAmetb5]
MPKTKSQPHPEISQVLVMEGHNNFPISWLNKQGYCEYSIYLENVKGLEVQPTRKMVIGTQEHARLEAEFQEHAEPATFQEMLETSKTAELLSREFPVVSVHYGIRGFIDEVWMTPEEFIIIDDKPGTRAYVSSINQVWGYCLAFQDMVKENRTIIGALRERGTDNIFWSAYFDQKAKTNIKSLIERIHSLLVGEKQFIPTSNPRKCRSCRLKVNCNRKAKPGSFKSVRS